MIPVFVSLGQSKNPVKRKLEEAIISELGKLAAFDVVVIPNLYDLSTKGESITALQQVTGDMLVFSWLYQRSTHWILDRNENGARDGAIVHATVFYPDGYGMIWLFDSDEDGEAEIAGFDYDSDGRIDRYMPWE